jgi:hypothetical protein
MRGDKNISLGLPAELFDDILTRVVSTSHRNNYDLGRVNRSWYFASLPHVYENWVWEDRRPETLILFLDTMLKKPELVGFVKSCRVRWKGIKKLEDEELLSRVSEQIQYRIRTLEVIRPAFDIKNFWEYAVPDLVAGLLLNLPRVYRFNLGLEQYYNLPSLRDTTVDEVFMYSKELEEPMTFKHTRFERTRQVLLSVMPWNLDFAMQRIRKLHVVGMTCRWRFFDRLANIEEMALVNTVPIFSWRQKIERYQSLKSFAIYFNELTFPYQTFLYNHRNNVDCILEMYQPILRLYISRV